MPARSRVHALLVTAGGVALFASLFLPWHIHGTVAGIAGFRLIDVGMNLRRNTGVGPPPWALALGYVVPLCGAGALVSLAAGTRRGAAVAQLALAATAAAVTLVAQCYLAWDTGPVVAITGAALLTAGAVVGLVHPAVSGA